MAEVEIHAAHAPAEDPFAQRVGVLVGIIGILLSVVTILSHREHTAAVVHKTEANDQWAFYQAKKIREHAEEIGAQILSAVAVDATRVSAQVAQRQQNQARYAKEAADIEKIAERKDADSIRSEDRALRFDFAEGFLELGLVMSSLYFLSHKRFFVLFGSTAALIGTVFGVIGCLS